MNSVTRRPSMPGHVLTLPIKDERELEISPSSLVEGNQQYSLK